MIRVFFGFALTALGLGLVGAFTGFGLVTGDDGAPIIMSAADQPRVTPAFYDGSACASGLLLDATPQAEKRRFGLRIVAVALAPDGENVEVGIRDVPGDAGAPVATMVLLLDEHGRLVGVHKEPALSTASPADAGCAAPVPVREGHTPI